MDEKLLERIQDERLSATVGMLTSYAEDLEDRLRDALCDAAEARAEKRVLQEELERLQTKLMTHEELTIRVRELEEERDQLQWDIRSYRGELRAALANLTACRQKETVERHRECDERTASQGNEGIDYGECTG